MQYWSVGFDAHEILQLPSTQTEPEAQALVGQKGAGRRSSTRQTPWSQNWPVAHWLSIMQARRHTLSTHTSFVAQLQIPVIGYSHEPLTQTWGEGHMVTPPHDATHRPSIQSWSRPHW
jgi:hypothetical protein